MCVTVVASQDPICYVAVYLSLNSGELTSTSCYMCGSWYLSMFLFRHGSLSMIRMASLIDLVMFCTSLPSMLKLSVDVA